MMLYCERCKTPVKCDDEENVIAVLCDPCAAVLYGHTDVEIPPPMPPAAIRKADTSSFRDYMLRKRK